MKKSKSNKVPINTVSLFPVLDKKLFNLLGSLSHEEWNSPTIASLWKVKDIAAHLLDGNVRTLSFSRDSYFGQQMPAIHSYQDLVDYLNKLNHTWTDAMLRVSPALLTELLKSTGKQFCRHIKQLDLNADAVFSVAWAGQTVSPNWFHIAREYTEKFLHQQQIREALGKPSLLTKKLYHPFLDTLMMALPHTYRDTAAKKGTIVSVIITGKAGGRWNIIKEDAGWSLLRKSGKAASAMVKIDPDDAWKLFSKSWGPDQIASRVDITGDIELGKVALNMVSVMA